MMEIFHLIIKNQLTPNQYYLLYSLREGISPLHINIHAELRGLGEEWLLPGNYLSPKAYLFLEEIDSYLKIQKKKTSKKLLGVDHVSNIEKYNELFPKIKLPSGKAARSAVSNLETNFKWFFENHTYGWDIILKATAYYIDEFERKNWLYMRNSQYFIKKQQNDKSIISELADYCAIVESGGMDSDSTHFSDKAT